MKKLSFLSLLLCAVCNGLLAQAETKSKIIIKKIIIENINGKETQKEIIDTLEISDLDENNILEKDLEVILKDGKNSEILLIEGAEGSSVHPEAKELEWINSELANSHSPLNKAVLGVQLENVNGNNGAQILEIFEGSAAQKAGLEEGDILLSIDGKETNTVDEILEALSDNKPGDKVRLSYLRGTKIKTVKATLQERTADAINIKACHPGVNEKMNCCKAGSNGNKCIIIKNKDGEQIIKEIGNHSGDSKINKRIIIRKHETENSKSMNSESETKDSELEGSGDHHNKNLEVHATKTQSLNVEYLASSPNPSNGQMKINFIGLKEPTTIQVLDLNGKEIYIEKLDNFDGIYNKEINIRNEAKGTLILKIIQGEKIISQKIIVE
ncbi:MAG: PDZ domain-containing protein [Saprospiraceae bacterium]|nr:PDZ domain-containing protein [Saprospiraceae bacterium]